MDRRTFLGTLAGGVLAAPVVGETQPAGKVARIGTLSVEAPPARVDATAKALGLTIPPSLLTRADQVIE